MKTPLTSRNIAACLTMLLFLLAGTALAQISESERWVTGEYEDWRLNYESYSQADALAAQERWKSIAEAIKNSAADDWAGNYLLACDSCEVSLDVLRWSPDAGFIKLYVYTCLPELRSLNFGSASESPAKVQLTPEYPASSGRKAQPALQLLKVKVGERRYLVAEDLIAKFCERVAGVEVKDGSGAIVIEDIYVKAEDTDKPKSGLPVLPRGYEHFLKRPIAAKILSVGKSYYEYEREYGCWKSLVTPVTLDAGSASGVKVGIRFKPLDDEIEGEFWIASVGKDSSRAIFRPFHTVDCEEKPAGTEEVQAAREPDKSHLRAGLRLSTRPDIP